MINAGRVGGTTALETIRSISVLAECSRRPAQQAGRLANRPPEAARRSVRCQAPDERPVVPMRGGRRTFIYVIIDVPPGLQYRLIIRSTFPGMLNKLRLLNMAQRRIA